MVFEGIASGYDDFTFRPTNPVSRQAMASWLFRDQLRMDFEALFPPTAPLVAPSLTPAPWSDASQARAPWCPEGASGGVLCP
jgi:hypothetical protein